MSIYWDTFTWEALATAFAGACAVGGAIWIGLKQTEILDRQVQILDRQVNLEELSLRASLFDRRFAVHQATLALVKEAIKKQDFPEEADVEFRTQREAARFLFPDQVVVELNKLHSMLIDLEVHKSISIEDPEPQAEVGKRIVSGMVKKLRQIYPVGVADIFKKYTQIN